MLAVLLLCASNAPLWGQENRPFNVRVERNRDRFVFLHVSQTGRLAASEHDLARWGLIDRVKAPAPIEGIATDLELYWLDDIEGYDLIVDAHGVTLAPTPHSQSRRVETGRLMFEPQTLRRGWGADFTYRVSTQAGAGRVPTPAVRGDLGLTLGALGRVVATVTRERQTALATTIQNAGNRGVTEGPILDIRDVRLRRDFDGGYALQAGELGASAGGLSTGLRYLGASVGLNTLGRARTTLSSQFARLEDLVTLTEPAEVEVRVNGRLVTRQRVGLGRLSVADIPLDMGDNDVEILVRMSDGRTETFSRRFVRGLELLGEGQQELAASAGFLGSRLGFFERGYDVPFSSASYARGLSQDHTMRLNSEFRAGDERHVAMRAEWAGNVPGGLLGRAGLSWNASHAPTEIGITESSTNRAGWLFDAGIDYLRERGSVRLGVSHATSGYLTMRQRGFSDEAPFRGRLDVTLRPGRIGTLGLRARHDRRRLIPADNSFFLTYQKPARAFNLRLEGGYEERLGRRMGRGSIAVYLPFGQRRHARMVVRRDGARTQASFDVSRSLSANETGLGWQLGTSGTMERGATRSPFVNGRLQVRTNLFEATVAGRHTAAGWWSSADVRGSFVFLGGQLLASRPVGQSFLLVDLGEGTGASVLDDSRPVGTVGKSGKLFIPFASSLSQKRIAINPASLRAGMVADQLQETLTLAPGGSTVSLPIRQTLQVRLVLLDENDEPWPIGTEIFNSTGSVVGLVGKAGHAYIVDVTRGEPLRATANGRSCDLEIEIGADVQGVHDRGVVQCPAGAN